MTSIHIWEGTSIGSTLLQLTTANSGPNIEKQLPKRPREKPKVILEGH